ncbi:MAG TPA: hypothetical protein VNJ01_05350 [Bacteriovoracaceae bacterium]|nr:hypothetical protein [Bacteriovoracaceae bacterium]
MKIFLCLILCGPLWAPLPQASAADVPISTGTRISYATEDLLALRGSLIPPSEILDLEEANRVLFSETRIQKELLRKVKYLLINGETTLAKIHLSKLALTQTTLRPVIYRYLAMLYFFEGRFDMTYQYLVQPELSVIPHFAKICPLKILSQIVLDKTLDLESEWAKCRIQNLNHLQPQKVVWLNTLVELKLAPRPGVTRVPFQKMKLAALNSDDLKMILKLALYLNQEELISPQIEEFTYDQYQDPEVRELAGQVLFRLGFFVKAHRFIEDLKSPNAENIKGNFYALQNKYELAYAQYKLALEQKQDSQNALERLLPLSWLLGDWEGGSKYAELMSSTAKTRISKMTLMAAFYVQKGDYEGALKILDLVAQRSQKTFRVETTQLTSFAALMLNRPQTVKKNALLSCAQYDLMNCWVLFQLGQWDNFPLTVRREDKLPDKKEWENYLKEDITEPLQETVYINQLDIEEMDDKLVQLIKKSP